MSGSSSWGAKAGAVGASIEWQDRRCGVVRQGERHKEPRSPFVWAAVAIKVDSETVEIQGLACKPSRTVWREVVATMKADGFKRIRYERWRNGEYRWHEIDL